MTWWQGLLTVSLGNVIVLVPMLLNAHPGTKYGIPFPVLVRSSFGIRGANVAAMARALVACGWFGIQTWIGALAVDTLMVTLWNGWADVGGHKAIAFGSGSSRWRSSCAGSRASAGSSGPPLAADRRQRRAAIGAFDAGGGIGNVSPRRPSWCPTTRASGRCARPAWPPTSAAGSRSRSTSRTSRATRATRSRRWSASRLAMPATMTGVLVRGSRGHRRDDVIYGEAIWDPVALVARLLGDLPILLILAMIVIVIAQLSTNMAANVVSPSNDFSNLSPRQITFRIGGLITAVIGDHLAAVEALRGRRRLRLHLARRLRQPAGGVRRR